jgi:hypothetical protein
MKSITSLEETHFTNHSFSITEILHCTDTSLLYLPFMSMEKMTLVSPYLGIINVLNATE